MAIESRFGLCRPAIVRRDHALWIFFPNGSGMSKISPAVLDKAAGAPVTTRNWRTVLKVQEMLGA